MYRDTRFFFFYQRGTFAVFYRRTALRFAVVSPFRRRFTGGTVLTFSSCLSSVSNCRKPAIKVLVSVFRFASEACVKVVFIPVYLRPRCLWIQGKNLGTSLTGKVADSWKCQIFMAQPVLIICHEFKEKV